MTGRRRDAIDAAAGPFAGPRLVPAPTNGSSHRVPASPPRRKKLWELDAMHHCPVVGTCLSVAELAKLARRFGYCDAPRDDYALHVGTVGQVGARTAVSEAVHKHLDRKYATFLKRFERAKTDAEVMALWVSHCEAGEVPGAMWAALTHKSASAQIRSAIYGQVHMLSHQVGAGQTADVRRLAELEREHREMRAQLESARIERARTDTRWRARVQALEVDVDRLCGENAEVPALRERLAGFESGDVIREMARTSEALSLTRDRLEACTARADLLAARVGALEAQLSALGLERDRLARGTEALERILLASDERAIPCASAYEGCRPAPTYRSVLCVGGRSALVQQYRRLAERLGVDLLHHDGGLEVAMSRLPEMIRQADAVLCPTDCVSHAAYYLLKSQCKRTGKPCLLFKGAGVSSFSVALVTLAGGTPTMTGDPRAEATHATSAPSHATGTSD